MNACKRALKTALLACVSSVDVHVEESAPLAPSIEEEICDRERAQRFAESGRVDVEPCPTIRLRGEDAGQDYLGHSVTSTEKIGGRWRAASTHRPPSVRAKTEPLCVTK